MTEVRIRYRRPGADDVTYRQELVTELADGTVVTLHPSTPVTEPSRVGGRVILEPGSPVVWFTFPGRWHDIGAFHRADGTFTGLYANILTPVELGPRTGEHWEWETTDLFLDLWLGRDADEPLVLDREEFEAAIPDLDVELVTGALAEVQRILGAHRNDEWPPAVVDEWPLGAARRTVRDGDAGQSASSPSTTQAAQSRSTSR